jgi:hypothetical protein
VGILTRYFRFIYRRRTFTSVAEINQALQETVARINNKVHSRFKVSRQARFEALEQTTLRPLPVEPWQYAEWKTATLHPDCTLSVDGNFYSAPHIHRGKDLRVKVSGALVEIFHDLERIAIHARVRGKVGERVWLLEHLPERSRAFHEGTPQMVLAQARFSHPALHAMIEELFREDTLAHLRRSQGLVRRAFSLIQEHGRETASPWIEGACAQMRRFGRYRVRTFEEQIQAQKKKSLISSEDRTIVRRPGNPMVRGHGTRKPESQSPVPTQLRLV